MTTPKALTPYELRGKTLVYLVDLEFAGRIFRLATTTTSVHGCVSTSRNICRVITRISLRP